MLAMQAERLLSQRRLLDFARFAWNVVEPENPYIESWHAGCLAEHLEAVSAGHIRKLVINCPPRCSKSLFVSVFWPCWEWTTSPHLRWIFGSYSSELAERDALNCRDLIESPWYQALWGHVYRLKTDQNAKSSFWTSKRGFRMAVDISGGASTGYGCDRLVADDPNKAQDAYKRHNLTKAIRWWTKAMTTRGNNLATMGRVICQQRVAEGDLSGYVLAESLGYEFLVLPMRYEPQRYLLPETDRDRITPTSLQLQRPHLLDGPTGSGRVNEGDLLFPQRIPEEAVQDLEKTLAEEAGPQLQQRNSAATGNIFKADHFRPYRQTMQRFRFEGDTTLEPAVTLTTPRGEEHHPIRTLRFFQCADTAMTVGTRSDHTAIVTCALTPSFDLLFWHVWEAKLEVPEQWPALNAFRFGPNQYVANLRMFLPTGKWPLPLVLQGVEPKASGIGLIQTAQRHGVLLHPIKVDGDKVARAAALAQFGREGKLYYPQGADWWPSFKAELLAFPGAIHDDRTDAATYCGYLAMYDEILRAALTRDLTFGDSTPSEEAQSDTTRVILGEDEDGNELTAEIRWDD